MVLFNFNWLHFHCQPRVCRPAAFFRFPPINGALSPVSKIHPILMIFICRRLIQPTETPLPIFYTMSPSGGGMVSTFQSTCSSLNIIVVASPAPRMACLGIESCVRFTQSRAMSGSGCFMIRRAEYVGGFSGGGECSYMFSRFRAQHVAGLFEMAGWLGRGNSGASVSYYGTDRVQTNLLIARTTGHERHRHHFLQSL